MTGMSTRSSTNRMRAHDEVRYERDDDEPLTVAVAEAVATYRGVDVIDLEPLHGAIDTDALERLFDSRAGDGRTTGTVAFEYGDCFVTITASGTIRVEPAPS